MWALIYILAGIVPLALTLVVRIFFQVRLWIIYLLLAGSLLFALIPDSSNLALSAVVQHWRYSLGQSDNPTSLEYYLRDNFDVSPELAEKMDFTKPTPFHIFLWLSFLALIGFVLKPKNDAGTSRVSEEDGGVPDS